MSDKTPHKSAEEIFHEAMEIESPKARNVFLNQVCGENDQLRAEVDALLRHDADAGSFLEKPAQEFAATENGLRDVDSDEAWLEVLTPSDLPDCIGTLGSYEVVGLIGRGGMGVVLRARDPKLNRIVAIKLLAPALAAQPMSVRRFLREAQAGAAVSHDHVVTIHAIDEQARPPLIVMECIDGQSLQQKIDREGVLDVKSILRIGMQTAAGLAAAHRQGLVHRDVKPSNILLENGVERVKLTDFGLARAVDDIGVTQTGQITGTPQYMSPEQAQGERVDHRTDLFSLGCVLYAMCTGRPAFRADSAVGVMHRVIHDDPRPIGEVNEDIPEWLCEIVDKLLAKNPDERFTTASEVEEILGDHLAHLQQPDGPGLSPRARFRRKKGRRNSRPSRNRTVHDPTFTGPRGHWLRHVPVPAWVALLLFLMVFVAATVEWSGHRGVGSRANEVAFYLLGTGFVLLWGASSLITQIVRGPGVIPSSLPPTRKHIASFFSVVILLTGAFLWQWAELGDKTERQRIMGWFFGHGMITLALDDPTTEVEFNGRTVEVPENGRVTLYPEWPGSFLIKIYRRDGSVGRGEVLVFNGMNAVFGSGVFSGAERVVVTGPIRGTVTDDSPSENQQTQN